MVSILKHTGNVYPLLLLIIFYVIAAIIGDVELYNLALFLYSQCSYFALGAITQKKCNIQYKDNITFCFTSYAIGTALCILLYAILLVFDIFAYSAYIYNILFISVWFCLLRNGLGFKESKNTNMNEIVIISLIVIAILSLGLLIFQLQNRSALISGYTDMFFDNTYWFKNCVASTKGYPLPELSVDGLSLYWHLFSCFNVALLHFLSGVEIYDLCFTFSYVWGLFILFGGIYSLFNELLPSKKNVYLALIILFFTSSLEPITLVYYLEHIYYCPLGCLEGISFSCFAFLLIYRSFLDKFKNMPVYLLSIVLFTTALGSKSPNGSIILISVFIYVVIYLYVNYKNIKTLYPFLLRALIYLIVFVVITKVFIADNNALTSDSSSHKLVFSLTDTITRTPYFNIIYDNILGKLPAFIFYPLVVVVSGSYILATNFVILIPLLFIILSVIRYKIKLDVLNINLLCITISGILLFLFVSHPGFSQVYFLFAIFPFALLFVIRVLDNFKFSWSRYMILYMRLAIGISIVVTLNYFQSIFIFNENNYQDEYRSESISGYDITKEELIALRWVRNNLPYDSKLATNKVLSENSFRSFVTSAYTERQIYLEGYGSTNLPNKELVESRLELLRQYYYGSIDARNELLNNGVGFAIYFKSINKDATPVGKIVFDNKDVTIYNLKYNE